MLVPRAAWPPAPARVRRLSAMSAALWPCALYFLCSLAMNILTKALLTTYAWRAVYALGALQNGFTLAALALHRALQAVTASASASTSPPPLAPRRLLAQVRVMAPLAALHLANVLLGFLGLRAVNLPMYLVLRRLTTLKIMLIEWLVLHKAISTPVKLALLVSALGSLLAGATDVTGGAHGGYALVLLQNVCSACSLAFSKESALSPAQLMALNAAVGTLCCSWLAWQLEAPLVRAVALVGDLELLSLLLATCAMCVLYQFSVHNCTLRTSALTTSVTGNVKDLAATVGGFLLFPDAHPRASNVAGVALSFLGAYSFSYARYRALATTDKPKQR